MKGREYDNMAKDRVVTYCWPPGAETCEELDGAPEAPPPPFLRRQNFRCVDQWLC